MTDNPIEAVKARLDGGRLWLGGVPISEVERYDSRECVLVAALNCAERHVRVIADIVAAVVKEQYPDRVSAEWRPGWTVAKFNDDERTTWPDVERVLEKASVLWDEAHS
jgi:hypothetical protein